MHRPSPQEVQQRVDALRRWMRKHSIHAFLIPTADPHGSEYLADHWKCREWITGFTGSAGTAVVTLEEAVLWTDSRYFLQAEQQLSETPFRLMREGEAGTPSMVEWMGKACAGVEEMRCCFDTRLYAHHAWMAMHRENPNLTFDFAPSDPFAEIWTDRPSLPCTPVYRQDEEYCGAASAREKMARIWNAVQAEADSIDKDHDPYDAVYLHDLAQIAWTLNLRGNDVAFNPVFTAFLVIREDSAQLFTDAAHFSPEMLHYLDEQRVELRPYEAIYERDEVRSTFLFAHGTSLPLAIKNTARIDYPGSHTLDYDLPLWIAQKNVAEICGFHRAMELDGVALVKFRRWLDERIAAGRIHKETEWSVAQKLEHYRAEAAEFLGLSFATIAGYEANGAIVHYEPTADHHSALSGSGLLLLDSGAQYTCGTTDLTRTIALGELTTEQRHVYTLVLKGHIALARAHFPEGTTGIQLDLAARYPLWQAGYDYGHGTGHGVGSHLCVHEGPQQIRKQHRPGVTDVPFRPGMVITDEPGCYVPGEFGVRIENLLLCHTDETTPFGQFMAFETLTLCPIDTAPIDLELLDPSEIAWLNDYHATVRQRLLPLLSNEADRTWLRTATLPL